MPQKLGKLNSALSKHLLSSVVAFFNLLPHVAATRLGSFLGIAIWAFSKRKVDKAEARCVSALGVGVTIARKIVRRSYANMGRSVVEFVRLPKLRLRLPSLVSIEGKEHLDEALGRGKGALLMTAHMGNWELAGARMVMEGYAITPIYTPQRNTVGVEDWVAHLRADGSKMKMVPSKGFALREAFRALRNGDVLTVLQDLDARKEGIIVPFLGVPASSATGIIKMHRRFGSPVVPVVALRDPDGIRHTVHIQRILSDLPDEEGNPFGVNMEKSLKICNNTLSGWIEEYPEQWMWLLDKWESVTCVEK
ncbi:MAG: lysophospholipid acyltransferase family protein [Synergistaceae bacterium]|jgi:KDO2-lipid IV(A) lauroyltransferase|nr:lysophospholipid acyltransferase family protein [Synergistaceae bacterium]